MSVDVSLETWETSGIKSYGDDDVFHDTKVLEFSFTFDRATVKVGLKDAKKIHEKLTALLADAAKVQHRCPEELVLLPRAPARSRLQSAVHDHGPRVRGETHQALMKALPYREQPVTELRCGRGHLHESPNAEGAHCCIKPCVSEAELPGSRWDPLRKIHRVTKPIS